MRTFKQHKESIQHAMNTANSSSKEFELIQATNISAGTIAGLFPIGQLMDKITVGSGDKLPANLAGIVMVRDTSDNSIMYPRGEAAVWSDEEVNRYYLDIERSAYSAVGFPFKSTGSISAGGSKLTCIDMVSLATGAYLYTRKVGDTAYQARIDADGSIVYDADGNIIISEIASSSFDPSLPGVRFYDSGETEQGEVVYYGENEELAYWYNSTYGWILTLIDDVGESDPGGYFDFSDNEGVGYGEFAGLLITMESIEESSVETIDDDDFSDLVVCITNETYGDFYYHIESVNEDFTFNLDGSHPFDETDATVTIYKERYSCIYFVDYSESELTSGTYDVYYWTYPNPLTQDDDIIPFAYPDYLELMTIRRLPETKNRRPVSKTELEDARAMAKKKEPYQKPPSRPKSRQGSVFQMGSMEDDTYTERGG